MFIEYFLVEKQTKNYVQNTAKVAGKSKLINTNCPEF